MDEKAIIIIVDGVPKLYGHPVYMRSRDLSFYRFSLIMVQTLHST